MWPYLENQSLIFSLFTFSLLPPSTSNKRLILTARLAFCWVSTGCKFYSGSDFQHSRLSIMSAKRECHLIRSSKTFNCMFVYYSFCVYYSRQKILHGNIFYVVNMILLIICLNWERNIYNYLLISWEICCDIDLNIVIDRG